MTLRRNTIQKDLVRDAVLKLRRHVTADEVYEFLKADHPSIGKGTVYRNLGVLVESGDIRRVEMPGSTTRYDFTLKNHYHVKCVQCGNIFDVDMDEVPDMMEKIHDKHGIDFLDYDISFKGICRNCKEREGVKEND